MSEAEEARRKWLVTAAWFALLASIPVAGMSVVGWFVGCYEPAGEVGQFCESGGGQALVMLAVFVSPLVVAVGGMVAVAKRRGRPLGIAAVLTAAWVAPVVALGDGCDAAPEVCADLA